MQRADAVFLDYLSPFDGETYNAIGSEAGITLSDLIALVINASVRKASASAAWCNIHRQCNVNPQCFSGLGHGGECDLEIPF